ncbi:hypothetical protein CFSAN001628_021430 [Clostridium botulinum CFSAN001628]|uniref:Uncharacterized protein n=1 Tax=Clostridium botulinum (strain Okra / Type B1) TaxID=498213 RepID=B1IJ91_CLOBK|nr:conserved hypothetical protein [Clostridium botulinum B1 str. Okra]EKX78117.1 hypothetical protein CFSAN001628_021430 [Clostridium botulinum CFSAN001628]
MTPIKLFTILMYSKFKKMLTNTYKLKTYNIKVQGIYFNKDIISLLFTNMHLREYYIKG